MRLFLLVKLSTCSTCLEWNIKPITLHNADLKCSSPNWETIMNLLCHSLPTLLPLPLFSACRIRNRIRILKLNLYPNQRIINIQLQLAIKAVLICTQRVINHKSKCRKSLVGGYHGELYSFLFFNSRKAVSGFSATDASQREIRSVQFSSFLGQESIQPTDLRIYPSSTEHVRSSSFLGGCAGVELLSYTYSIYIYI